MDVVFRYDADLTLIEIICFFITLIEVIGAIKRTVI